MNEIPWYIGSLFVNPIKSPESVVTIDTIQLKDIPMSRSLGYVTVVNPDTQEISSIRYDEFVRLLFKQESENAMLRHASLGIADESFELREGIENFLDTRGKLIGDLKKLSCYNKEEIKKNIIEELGDGRFYEQVIMNLLNITEQEVLQANANKLAKRYQGLVYSDKAAIDRADKSDKGGE
jgi:uncharacterized protein YabN with tetrapyrrole methylase and pyrophosphatase domain